MQASILIVDDEGGIRDSLGALLRDEGYEVHAAGTAEECLELVEQRHFDLVLMDVWLPKLDGLSALEQIQSHDDAPMVVEISWSKRFEIL